MVLNETTRLWFQRAADFEEPKIGADMRAIAKPNPDPAAVKRLSAIPRFNSQMRTTCVATMLQGGHAPNALPQLAKANVNCRILPGEPVENVEATLKRLAGSGVTVSRVYTANPSQPSPITPELFGAIERLSAEYWPGAPIIPSMSAGATDGAFLRNIGIPTYVFAPHPFGRWLSSPHAFLIGPRSFGNVHAGGPSMAAPDKVFQQTYTWYKTSIDRLLAASAIPAGEQPAVGKMIWQMLGVLNPAAPPANPDLADFKDNGAAADSLAIACQVVAETLAALGYVKQAVDGLGGGNPASALAVVGPVMQQILEARDDELVARVTRSWALPGELRLLVLRWRDYARLPCVRRGRREVALLPPVAA